MTDEFDDILGNDPAPKKAKERSTEVALADKGVTIDWLAANFHLPRSEVVQKLRNCPCVGRRTGFELYEVRKAAAYLVDPEFTPEQFPQMFKNGKIPFKYQEGFWNAKIKEMKFRVLAGELWPTESVMEVLADTFQLMSGKIKLWVDDLEEINELSEKQRKSLLEAVDDLTEDIRKGLVEKTENKFTESYVAEMDE